MDYWKTPIDQYILEDDAIIKDALNIVLYTKPITTGTSLNLYDPDSKFFQWILECSNKYLSDHYKEYTGCSIKRAWALTQLFGMNTEYHSHDPSYLAAVYYVNANSNHPELEIFDPRPPHMFNSIHRNNVSNCRSIKIVPVTNNLILFPGYLLHGVGTNMSNEPRVCIAMNIDINK